MLHANGIPMLGHLINRLKSIDLIGEIVLATTVNPKDDLLVEYAHNQQISFFRGSEDDVMSRVIDAADSVGADLIVDITGDCPIIDPLLIKETVHMFFISNVDYVSNAHIRSFPDGMDCQVFRLRTLKKSASMTNDRLDREHVTLHIRNNPEIFSHAHYVSPSESYWPELGLTLDEVADYTFLKRIIEHFGSNRSLFSCLDVIELLRKNPEWVKINQSVQRKGDT